MAHQAEDRLLVAAVDEFARTDPDRVVASYPIASNDFHKGFRDVTTKQFADGVNRLCAFLEAELGRSGDFEVATYFGPMDMRYHLITPALLKLGWVALMDAPRNSPLIHAHLFSKTGCKAILRSSDTDLSELIDGKDLKGKTLVQMPELEELLWSDDAPKEFKFKKTFAEAKDETFVILHSSGSTGLPKPIRITHAYMNILLLQQEFVTPDGRPSICKFITESRRTLSLAPPWHAGGQTALFWNLCFFSDGHAYVWGAKDRFPTLQDVVDAVEIAKCDMVAVTPQLLVEISRDPHALEVVSKVKGIGYGGG